jgi:NADH:ubiquinone oxidoreductase subunit H
VEYGGGFFSFIFIYEYGMAIFVGYLTVGLFFGARGYILKVGLFRALVIWVRACFPRFRYDMLMYSAWKIFLPFSIGSLVLVGVSFSC